MRYELAPGSILVGSVAYERRAGGARSEQATGYETGADDDRYTGEAQHLWWAGPLRLVSGAALARNDSAVVVRSGGRRAVLDEDGARSADYLYALGNHARSLTLTVGGATEWVDAPAREGFQFNPKVGLLWALPVGTTLRAAVFRTLAVTAAGDQTIEPTQFGGFNQRFDDPKGTSAWRWGLGLDQRLGPRLLQPLQRLTPQDLRIIPAVAQDNCARSRELWRKDSTGGPRSLPSWTPSTTGSKR